MISIHKDIELLFSGVFVSRDSASSHQYISCRAAVDLLTRTHLLFAIMLRFISFLFGHRYSGFVASNASVVVSKNVLYIRG
jgi:hypothetical protein